ncbi:WG repeat-containing protein [Spirosoma validum]|uniref:WG repeat-containing protein n=1 Tax=Spirosoma validum TaxID=2771355 RepID=A0A927GFM7_9BACT|nr:WG repeat-containing protein [Spirosoma validum]MBD2755966.1 WG repeat-containing protein [Spirosoma validum]
MTETELIDRLREAIVLDGPDVWRTNGYLQDAQQAGLSLPDALKRANEVSQEVSNNSILFQNIQARIARLAQPSRAHLIDQDLNQIINAATSLKLSPDFVKNRWVPTILHRLAVTSAPPKPEPPVTSAPSPVTLPVEKPDIFDELIDKEPELPKPPAPVVEPPVSERIVSPPTPVSPPTVEVDPPTPTPTAPSRPEPPPIVRSFTATPARVGKGQPVTLAWEVENLLAVTIDDLGEGLSPSNRGWVKPLKTTDYTLFDANNNPLSTVRVEVIKPDRSGIYGVLFALALLAIIYWFIKSSNSRSDTPVKSKRKTEQTTERKSTSLSRPETKPTFAESTTEATDTPEESTPKPTASVPVQSKRENSPSSQPEDEMVAANEPTYKPATPADARQGKYEETFGNKPYDKVELGTDELGWRRARSKGRWGYINEDDEWVIQPEFEAVTPFRGNTAAVFLNGQLMTINRSGEQVRK